MSIMVCYLEGHVEAGIATTWQPQYLLSPIYTVYSLSRIEGANKNWLAPIRLILSLSTPS